MEEYLEIMGTHLQDGNTVIGCLCFESPINPYSSHVKIQTPYYDVQLCK